MKVSVLVPVYGVEQYLKKFLDTLSAQNMVDCEFIIVNDASPDKSHDIIVKHIKNDSRFKYINKSVNQGEMQAREDAFKISTGKYIINLDSDDFINDSFLLDLYEYASNHSLDMVLSNVISVNEDGNEIANEYRKFDNSFIFNSNNMNLALSLPYSSWSRLTKRQVLDKFSYSYLQGETSLTRLQFLSNIKSGFCHSSIYYYRQRKGSLSSFENSSKKYSSNYGIAKIKGVYADDLRLVNGEVLSINFKVFRVVNISKLIFLSYIANGNILDYRKEIKYLRDLYDISNLQVFILCSKFPLRTKFFSYMVCLGLSPILLFIKRFKK